MGRIVETLLPERLGREFRRLVAASWTLQVADGISLAAGPLLVASETQDPLLVAMAPLLQRLPWLLFGLYAGALADRLDRRLLLVVANLARAAVLAVLVGFVALDRAHIWLVLVVVFLFGVAETFADTTAHTLTPMLVPKPDLGIANARMFAGFITVNQMLGPPLGAALFAAGTVWPFVTELVCVVLAVLIASRLVLPAHGRSRAERTHLRRDIADGLRWLWQSQPVRTLALVIVTFNVTFGAAFSVLVLYATVHLGMGEVGFGLLTTLAAAGGLLSTACYGWLERHVPLGTLMKTCLVLEVFMHLGFALTTTPWVAMLIMFGFGCYAFVWGTLSQAVRQRAVPMEFQGRVSSAYSVGVFGGIVLGSALGGVIAQQWGILAPFWFGFVGSAVFLALIWRQLALIVHADEAALREHPVPGEVVE